MRSRILLLIIIIQCLLHTACSVSQPETGPRKEASAYMEDTVEIEGSPELNLLCESGNIEFYSWDRKNIKFEVTKRVTGRGEKSALKDKLDDLEVDITSEGNKVFLEFRNRIKRKKVYDCCVDLRIYMPKGIAEYNLKQDNGNIRFFDDAKGILKVDIACVKLDINRFEGVISVKGNSGSINISGGKLKGESGIAFKTGNISIKSELEENGEYTFSTEAGNIDLYFPEYSRVSFENIGQVEKNEFEKSDYAAKVKVISLIGTINLCRY